jgi:predicted DNA-binding transcriptional regulator AlpA
MRLVQLVMDSPAPTSATASPLLLGSRDAAGNGATAPWPEYMSDKALAQYLGVSPRSVWRATSAGELPQPRRVCGCTRWLKSEVDERLRSAPTAEPRRRGKCQRSVRRKLAESPGDDVHTGVHTAER